MNVSARGVFKKSKIIEIGLVEIFLERFTIEIYDSTGSNIELCSGKKIADVRLLGKCSLTLMNPISVFGTRLHSRELLGIALGIRMR